MKKLNEILNQIGFNKSNGLFFLNEEDEKDYWKNNTLSRPEIGLHFTKCKQDEKYI